MSFRTLLGNVRGFTLLELLAAMCVAAILVVLLFGGIQSFSASRQSSQCASNLRQLYMLMQAYAAENDGYIPRVLDEKDPENNNNRPSFYNTLEKAGIFAVYGSGGWSGKDKQHIARCPAREFKAAHTKIKSKAGHYHYGMNNCPGGLDTASGPVKFVGIERPSQTFLIADSDSELWVGRIKGEAVKVNHAAYPHREGINLVFADGHAEWHAEPLPEITSTVDSPPFPWW